MAIRTKQTEQSNESAELSNRDNPAINKKIDAHIAAFPKDFAYYTKLVTENPERAVRKLIQKDQMKYESDMKLVAKQMPGAKEWLEQQPADVRQRVDRALEGVNPYLHDKTFVGEVLREMGHQNRKALTTKPTEGVRAAAG